MAVVGILASVATIGFILWIQYVMARQREVGQPLVRSALRLEYLLERTFVELRGWIAYGDPDNKRSRSELWNEGIAESMQTIAEAAGDLRAGDVRDDVAVLKERLRKLRYFQWYVEDIARTLTNEPARRFYSTALKPFGKRGQLHLTIATQPRRLGPDVTQDAQLLLSAFLAADRAVAEMLRDGTAASISDVRRTSKQAQEAATAILDRWSSKRIRGDGVEALVAGAQQAHAYAVRVPRVVALRSKPDWNVSETLYRNELKPLQLEVEALAQKISQSQIAFVQRQARGLFRWSFVVLGLAFLLGGLSVAAVYVNYRLEYRVQRALSKASSLGKYVIEERIGGGAMGEVFRARHALLRRPSAVKVLRVEQTLDPTAQERFQEEVQLTSQLTHPNTIAIFDYGRTPEGLFYYAMELLNGVGLDVLVATTGRLPPGRVIHVLRQVCASLAESHERGLIHRDIKPSNIMLTELGGVPDWVKVLDFGLATRAADADPSQTSSIVGTPAYLAPEVVESHVSVSPRSDLYAVGAVGYFLMTGTPVFARDDVAELLKAHATELPERPSVRLQVELPDRLEMLVLACLAKDPSERPTSAAELGAMLEQIDVEPWTRRHADAWWDEYGDAVRTAARTRLQPDRSSRATVSFGSGIEIGGASRA